MKLIMVTAGWLVAGLLCACAPAPKYVGCRTDGECKQSSEGDYAYCLQSRCVACLGKSMCASGQSCVDGTCTPL